jgi:hypothetical protein
MTPYDGEASPMDVEVRMPGESQEPQAEKGTEGTGHRDNLTEYFDDDQLAKIANDIIEDFDNDDATRSDWLKTYKRGLDYLGFSMEDRTKPFKNASGVFHPIMAEAVIRFQSNAIIEIFPASGPTLVNVLGDETPDKVKQAKRVKEEFNYQLTENMCEYRVETEQLLFRLPLSGSVFKKVYYDPLKNRPSACMVVAEDFVVNYGATELENVERAFHVIRKSTNEVRKLMRSGFYRQVDLPKPIQNIPEGRRKEDRVTGVTQRPDTDNRHTLIEAHIFVNLPVPFEDPDGVADPYVVTIEKDTRKVLSIYRNWREDDPSRNPEQYFIHYQYMPGLGFYGFGLAHLMGSIAKATTSILRQLIDAGTLSNLPGGLKTKGLRVKGEDTPIQPGEWRDVDLPPGAIGDNLFPLPYKEPSAVLVALLEMLVDEGRRIGSIADLEISSSSQNAPVGTTLALMERSLKVMSAVHARLHASLRKELKLIGDVIANYMPPKYDWDDQGQFDRRADFDARVDVIPVSDPNAATQAQKIVQLQAVQQLAAMNPELYNMKELHRVALQAIGVKDDERILPVDEPPPLMDPVQENMAILTSQPIKVYPEQDHTAHIQVHLSFINDPKILEMITASPNLPKLQGSLEAHVAEHLAFQYREEMQQVMGVELPPMGQPLPPEVENHLSRLVADASVRLREKHDAQAAKKAAEEVAKDPVFQLREREVALKERQQTHTEIVDTSKTLIDIAKEASKESMDMRRIESEETRAGAKIGADLVTFGATLDAETRQQGVELGKEMAADIHQRAHDQWRAEEEFRQQELERANKIAVARARPKPTSSK